MGHHFVPQRYLRGFQSPERPGWIWTFDKQTQTRKHLPIRQVAQSPNFYEKDVEVSLNLDVEIPGNDVIDKVVRGDAIDETDQRHLTYYIGTMIRRVPNARKMAENLLPKALAEVTQETKSWFESAAQDGEIDADTLAARLAEIDDVHERFLKQTPAEVRRKYETPWPFASCLIAIHSMHWRVLHRAAGPSKFLTSDNPAYFFEGFGLGHHEAELIFPLTSDVLLHCSWQPCDEYTLIEANEQMVKEMNRRIASGATRFVFYHQDATWIHSAARNRPEQLNRIRWN